MAIAREERWSGNCHNRTIRLLQPVLGMYFKNKEPKEKRKYLTFLEWPHVAKERKNEVCLWFMAVAHPASVTNLQHTKE